MSIGGVEISGGLKGRRIDMSTRAGSPASIFYHGGPCTLGAVAVTFWLMFAAAAQQTATQGDGKPAQPPAAAPAAPAPAPRKETGFLDAVGKWFDQSAADLNSGLKKMKSSIEEMNEKAGQATKDAANAAKDATETMMKLPSARVMEGRERCELAPNGSPDCRVAAEAICKGKGFTGGKSVDTQTAQKCPARIWLSGRQPGEGDCQVETYVIRAVCQ